MTRRKNTLTKFAYIVEHVAFGVVAFFWYMSLFYRNIKGIDAIPSRIILIGLVLGCMLITCVLTIRRERNYISALFNIVMPYGIYAMLSFYDVFSKIVVTIFNVMLLLIAINVVVLLGRKINSEHRKEVLLRRLQNATIVARNWICVASVALFAFLGGKLLLFDAVAGSDTTRLAETSDYTIENHIDELVNFQETRWAELSLQERTDLCALVIKIETTSLGLPETPRLVVDDLDTYVLGEYAEEQNLIKISTDHILYSKSEDVLRTICHELRHHYQFQLTQLYATLTEEQKQLKIFEETYHYVLEFEDYTSPENDIEKYFGQHSEVDARAYGEASVIIYFKAIEEYLQEQGEGAEVV